MDPDSCSYDSHVGGLRLPSFLSGHSQSASEPYPSLIHAMISFFNGVDQPTMQARPAEEQRLLAFD
jgi:hypothetical protein